MKPDRVQVQPGPVGGAVEVPGSKSVTHRALLLAAQSESPCIVRHPLLSADTNATLSCLHAIGARVHLDADGRGVQFLPAPLRPPREVLDCANSGTTLRLLAGTAARFAQPVTLDGDGSLRGRPNGALLDALRSLGARTQSLDGKAPLTVQGPIRPGAVLLPPSTSSQFASSLLLSLPFMPGDSTVAMAAPVSSGPYLDVTCDMAAKAGLKILLQSADGRRTAPSAGSAPSADGPAAGSSGRTYRIPGGQRPACSALDVEADWSTAAFPLVAAAVSGGSVTVHGVRADSRQGDRAILDVLRSFGAKVRQGEAEASCEAGPLQSPGTVDVSATPDLFPVLCVLAAVSRGTTTFTGGASLRAKESDRIAAMAAGLAAMGAKAQERPDGLVVEGGTLRGATVASLGDHRIHMAFVVAGLAAHGATVVDGASSAAVSYPRFHQDFVSLGARLSHLHGNRAVVA